MNVNLRTHAQHRAISCRNLLAGLRIAVSLAAAALALPASSRTVYDAGKAFNDVGHNTASFAPWSLLRVSGEALSKEKAFETYASTSGNFKGISGQSNGSSPWIRVNTGAVSIQSGEEVLPNELLVHPANPYNESYPSDVVRFTAPEDGWYSANIFAHDTSKESNNTSTTNSGVQVSIRAQGNILVRQIVSLENYTNNYPTHQFNFQMPVRHLAAGDTIEVVIGNKYNASNAHSSDMTGLRFIVTKEDEGAFYDSGIAMLNCVASDKTYANPYGTIKDGSWYFLTTTVPTEDADLAELAPGNFSRMTSARISAKGTLSGGLVGFGTANGTSIKSPYVMANGGSTYSASTAPGELQAHPTGGDNKKWTTIRFRPSVSGYYSASVVARHVDKGAENYDYTGVDVYLLASEQVVTNAYVFIKDFSATTARLTFNARLFAAGEPIDIVIAPHGDQHSDATAVSAIFRREEGATYDAGISYYEEHASGRCSSYFSDSSDGNAKWMVAMKSGSWNEAHSALGTYLSPSGTMLTWWTHATGTSDNGTPPRFAMATNAIASADSIYLGGTGSPLLATTPYELVVQPQNPSGSNSGSVSLRAEVPSNGIYRVRSYARDLNGNTGSSYDGVCVIVSAGGYAPASAVVSRDNDATYPYEAALSADRLWMKQGEAFYFTVDPRTSNYSDSTGLSACYVLEDAAPTAHVVNIDIAGAGTGRLSNYVGAGREGWSDWNKWNALRLGAASSAAAENCREADGTTPRNVTLSLTRSSGAAIATASGSTGCEMLDAGVSSTGSGDTYAFTLSKLEPGAEYTLYFYGTGDAQFSIGGVTKGLEEPWCAKDANALACFSAEADSNGQISGTFAAADANGGAFNGLTLVGEFPDYIPEAFVLTFR